jgi:hypothetical protein
MGGTSERDGRMNGVYHSDRHEHLALGPVEGAGSTRNKSRCSVGTEELHGRCGACGGRVVLLRGSLRTFFLPGKISMHEAIVTM